MLQILGPAMRQANGFVWGVEQLCRIIMGLSGFIAALRIYNNIQTGKEFYNGVGSVAWWFLAAVFFQIGVVFVRYLV